MSKLADVAYDIEQLYIEGLHPTKICRELDIPLTMVYDWLESTGVDAEGPAISEGEAVFASMVKELA
jgi:hypothetical protein